MMKTQCLLGLKTFVAFAAKVWSFILYILRRQIRTVIQYQTVRYDILPLSPISRNRLSSNPSIPADCPSENAQHRFLRACVHFDFFPFNILKEALMHCTLELGSYIKDLSVVHGDLSSIIILDNSPGAYRSHPDNAIPIKSWFSDPSDTALLNLLPMLDALRFTADVRSVLSRNLHQHRLW
ncbi:CTD nuclear envelope phosphatase 1B-like [Hemiscyllium ocellatum]|uniref:CTD nuclear envelope phosphatase 1B-like n=1 Tax=Hemiscyllium ocellatum TaxID=170820 RepID=UPI0029675DB5|nr:CTD nuclear envelope phosphatase 1B-like [Hemiscyllium ocellatum]